MKMLEKYKYIIVLIMVILCCNKAIAGENPGCFTQNLELFNYFSFEELKSLLENKYPMGTLGQKLNYALSNPVVDNTVNCRQTYPLKNEPQLGDYFRVTSWNIDRGFNFEDIKLLFTNQDELFANIKTRNENVIKKAMEQAREIQKTDILILNEVDAGMPRTGYKNVAQELARALNFNYAYGIEFLEVDPAHLGLENYKWSEESFLFPKENPFKVDESKYRGLHGTAILSRFPLRNVRIIKLPKYYDWYTSEKDRISGLEEVRRSAAGVFFKEEMLREIRQGNRIALAADINIPGLTDPVTIIAVHLENRTTPKGRKGQITSLMRDIYNIKNPVILAGDFNTTGSDGSPTGVSKEIMKKLKDPEFIAKNVLLSAVPSNIFLSPILTAGNFARTFVNPTVANIPVIAPNPEHGVFGELEDMKFADGYTFDFRGNTSRSFGKKFGVLADSNERSIKGFTPTFIFERPLGVGKYKLDWIFVKPYIQKSNPKKGSYKMAPHFGRTYFELNYVFDKPISDHAPVSVDIPVTETQF